jgi:D-alanyl-D-alanine carboxypeptidase/D-alanyl-D-alanine-endopeptidase (penicillin-binding protein 4)
MTDEPPHEQGDESPPTSQPGRTPAERAGATPLDPERFKANAGMPVVQRQREIVGRIPEGEAPVDPVVRRRRSRPRHGAPTPRSARVRRRCGAVLGGSPEWLVHRGRPGRRHPPSELRPTPVLSARRTPELLARPVAARNLRAAVDPVLAQAPPDTCLQVREGANALVSQREGDPVVPASNLKLVTAAAALDVLDPDSRFTTRFATDGAPTDGTVVRGNLYMIGGGDPLLSTSGYLAQLPNGEQSATDMDVVADQIAATGIREITGSVVGDESRYDDVRTVDAWPERFIAQGQVAPAVGAARGRHLERGRGPGGDPATHARRALDLLEERVGSPALSSVHPSHAAACSPRWISLTVAEIVDEALRYSDNTTAELLVRRWACVLRHGSTGAGLTACASGSPSGAAGGRRRASTTGRGSPRRTGDLRPAHRAVGGRRCRRRHRRRPRPTWVS